LGKCQHCGREAPTRKASLYKITSVVFISFHQSIEGQLCRGCIAKTCLLYNLHNTLLGWWSFYGVILNTFALLNNTVMFLRSLGPGPTQPEGPGSVE
ncbi:MAG: hypothetical protein ACYTHN_20975, partial [Planctomycetota bacterium]|jgi:hypothetical protein